MRSRLGHQFGPWNNNEQTSIGSRQYFISQHHKDSTKKIILPKLEKVITYPLHAKNVQIKIKQNKQKNQQQLKINPVEIQLLYKIKQQRSSTNFYSTKKYNKLFSNPPMISFYNKKHPKIKRLRQKNSTKISFVPQKKTQSDQQSFSKPNFSKINLMEGYISSTQTKKNISNRSQSFQGELKQVGRKSSLTKLLTYLKSSQNQISWSQRVSSYLKKQQLNGISRYSCQNQNFNINTVSLDQQAFHPYKEVQKFCYISKQKPKNESNNL